jgi:two-component system LytT family response regulator
MTLRAVIVDDEQLAREKIAEMLESENDVEIVGEYDGGQPAIEGILDQRPDLVFLDVRMPEVDGFSVVEAVADEHLPAVVFVTAYEEHAIRAFEAHALDYLLKPFRPERFRAALERARAAVEQSRAGNLDESIHRLLQTFRQSARRQNRLVVRSPGRVHFVPLNEIDWVESAGNYVLIHTGTKSHLLRETMTDLGKRLDSERFLRIHRSTIVNIDRVAEVRTSPTGDARVILSNRKELPLSRRYRRRFEEFLDA